MMRKTFAAILEWRSTVYLVNVLRRYDLYRAAASHPLRALISDVFAFLMWLNYILILIGMMTGKVTVK